jgi:hypothetical protein
LFTPDSELFPFNLKEKTFEIKTSTKIIVWAVVCNERKTPSNDIGVRCIAFGPLIRTETLLLLRAACRAGLEAECVALLEDIRNYSQSPRDTKKFAFFS